MTRFDPDTTPITVSSSEAVEVPFTSTLSMTTTTAVPVGKFVAEASGTVVVVSSATPPAPICPTHLLLNFLNMFFENLFYHFLAIISSRIFENNCL